MALVDADPRRAIRRVRRTLDDATASLVGRRIVALCSGGIDSTVLVALLARLPRGAAPASIDVLFLDHGLRDGGGVEAERAAAHEAAEFHGCTFHAVRRDTLAEEHDHDHDAGAGAGVQAAARAWRLATAIDLAQRLGCDVVATGHTADDQLECALLGLVGVTAAHPTTMPVARALTPHIRLVRPMLGLTRADIDGLAANLAIRYAEDPTNADPDAYLRNAIRHRVVPALLDVHPGAGVALARVAERERERTDANRGLADALLTGWGVDADADATSLDVRQLAPLAPPARRAVLDRWLRRAVPTGGTMRAIDARTIRAVDRLAVLPGRAACARVDLAGNACVRRDGYDLRVSVTSDDPGADHQ